MNWKLRVLRGGEPATTGLSVRRDGDGGTALGLGPDAAERIVRWSQRAAARKQSTRRQRGAGGAAPGDPSELAGSVDLETGEIVSSEPVQQDGPHRSDGSS